MLRTKGNTTRKSDGGVDMQKKVSLTVRLSEDTFRQFRIKLAERGEKAQAVLERAVEEYLEKGGKR
jgi:predicted DNA binding CopG/RHH family protein